MTSFSFRCLMIVRAAHAETANRVALTFDPVGGDKTFTVGLSPTGAEPATHYWASVATREAAWLAIRGFGAVFDGSVVLLYDMDNDPLAPSQLLAAMGLRRVENGA